MKRGGSLSFLVRTISNVLVMEIGWTEMLGVYLSEHTVILVFSFFLQVRILQSSVHYYLTREYRGIQKKSVKK